MYDIEFNHQAASKINLFVVKRPDIPIPRKKYTEHEIPGRDGMLYEDEGTVEDIEIPIEFNFMDRPEKWAENLRNAKKWLLNGKGNLKFSDDPDFFYKAKKVEIDTAERVCYEIGRFTATFFCYGYHYFVVGEHEYETLPFNPGIVSHPIYNIKGTGNCVLAVNGKTMTAKVQDNLTIDTELMVSYRENGELDNTSVFGWYEDLYLNPWKNEVTITDNFKLTIIPRWRCL